MLNLESPVVCHYDINYDNLLYYPDDLKSLFIVDFEMVNWGPEGLDMGAAMIEFVINKEEFFKAEKKNFIFHERFLSDN